MTATPAAPTDVTQAPEPFQGVPSPTLAELKGALGRFATGVTIVTASGADGEPVGITANSFNSVSLSPALVLWSVAHTAGSFAVFTQARHYAIHVLSAEQRPLAERFATRGVDRWAGVRWHRNEAGVPILDGALALFECRSRSQYPEGDHVILVGEVERCSQPGQGGPLLYHGGRFYTEHPL